MGLLVTMLVIVGPTAEPGAGQDQAPWTDITVDGSLLTVTAGAPGSLRLTESPGEGGGQAVHCGWFEVVTGGPVVFDIVPAVAPVVGDTYLLWCAPADGGGAPLPGYPVPAVYGERELPGAVVSTGEAARFALDSIGLQRPAVRLTPPGRQVVGVHTDLEVVSRLDYPPASAEAGPVWATVVPVFGSVEWQPGNGDTVVCGRDGACRSVFEVAPPDDLARSAVTVHWIVHERTDKTAGVWQVWGTVSLTAPLDIEVTALQAAIR